MTEISLVCGTYGDGTVFPVTISRDAKVHVLQEAIFHENRYQAKYTFDAYDLTLYLAQKNGAWLKDDHHVDAFLQGGVDKTYVKMRSTWTLDPDYLGKEFEPGLKDIHVLVELPADADVRVKRARTEGRAHPQVIPVSEWFDGMYQEQSPNARYLRMKDFPPLAHKGAQRKVIYERCCYRTIFEQLLAIIRGPRDHQYFFQNVVVNGNPGIGKSRFYLYCIFRLALDDGVRRQLPPGFQLVINYEKHYHTFDFETKSFTRTVDDKAIRALQNNHRVVRLVEDNSDRLQGWSSVSVFFPRLATQESTRF